MGAGQKPRLAGGEGLMGNPMYKWHPRPVSRDQLQNFLRENLDAIRREKDAGIVGPATARFRKMAARVTEPTTPRGENDDL